MILTSPATNKTTWGATVVLKKYYALTNLLCNKMRCSLFPLSVLHIFLIKRVVERHLPELIWTIYLSWKSVVFYLFQTQKSHSVLDLGRTPNLRKLGVVFIFLWFIVSMVYFGMTYNVSEYSNNIYMIRNTAFSAVILCCCRCWQRDLIYYLLLLLLLSQNFNFLDD